MIPDLATVAHRHGGTFVRRAAVAAGLHDRTLRRLVNGEEIRRAIWADTCCRGLRICRACCYLPRDSTPDCCLTHQSAFTVHGLSTFGLDLSMVHIARTAGVGRLRTRRRDLAAHILPPGAQVQRIDNFAVVDPATAIVQVAATGALVAAAADEALQAKTCGMEDLITRCGEWNRRPGASRVCQLPRLVDGRSESPGESRSRLFIGSLGFRVTPQVWIATSEKRYRVDLLDDDLPLVIEFDGQRKYGDDPANYALEKRREDDLPSLGYVFVRYIWSDLMNPVRAERMLLQGRRSPVEQSSDIPAGSSLPGRCSLAEP